MCPEQEQSSSAGRDCVCAGKQDIPGSVECPSDQVQRPKGIHQDPDSFRWLSAEALHPEVVLLIQSRDRNFLYALGLAHAAILLQKVKRLPERSL